MLKSWHVKREKVMEVVFEGLRVDDGPQVVGLVGNSGSGKTTAASEIVRCHEILERFSDGVLWLSVNDGAKARLPTVMLQLATMLHDIGGGLGRPPASDHGATYIRGRVNKGRNGRGLRCLVVADNVWEEEVVAELRETGMWVLLTTRTESLVTGVDGETIGIDQLSEEEAEEVLRRASELPSGERLPDAARELIVLCGRVAMELAFVGRWSTVRERKDGPPWLDAIAQIRAKFKEIDSNEMTDGEADAPAKRRMGVLRAGFNNLAVEDSRVQFLYLSLAVMPASHAFSAKDAAVLLYDRQCSVDDEEAAKVVVHTLERWGILRAESGEMYRMHDAHSSFARESLKHREDVRRSTVERWTQHLSSLKVFTAMDTFTMVGLWSGVECVGRAGWCVARTHEETLAKMDEGGLISRDALLSVAHFCQAWGDSEGEYVFRELLLKVLQEALGRSHPYSINTMSRLAECAEQLGMVEEEVQWRKKLREQLELGKHHDPKTGSRSYESSNANELVALAVTMMSSGIEHCCEAERYLQRALGIQVGALGPTHLDVADTLEHLGDCVRIAGWVDEAEKYLRRALEIRESQPGVKNDATTAIVMHELGLCVQKSGRLAEAENLFRRSLEIAEAKVGPDDRTISSAVSLHQLGVCVREARRLDEAETIFRRALDIEEAKLGHDNLQTACTMYELGVCLEQPGRLEEAETFLRGALEIEEAKLGPNDLQTSYTLFSLGACVREEGRKKEAETLLRRALEIEETQQGPESIAAAYTLHELGTCLREMRRNTEAETLLRRALSIMEAELDDNNVGMAYTLYQLSVCVREARRNEEAETLLARALELEEGHLGADAMEVAYTLDELGVWSWQTGRVDEAETLFRRALRVRKAKVGRDGAQAQTPQESPRMYISRNQEGEALFRQALAIQEDEVGPGAAVRQEVRMARRATQYTALVQAIWEEQHAAARRRSAEHDAARSPTSGDVTTQVYYGRFSVFGEDFLNFPETERQHANPLVPFTAWPLATSSGGWNSVFSETHLAEGVAMLALLSVKQRA